MSKGMIKVFLFYQRLARKEKLLLLLAGSQALCKSQERSFQAITIAAAGEALSGSGRAPRREGLILLPPTAPVLRHRHQPLSGGKGSQARLLATQGSLGGTQVPGEGARLSCHPHMPSPWPLPSAPPSICCLHLSCSSCPQAAPR